MTRKGGNKKKQPGELGSPSGSTSSTPVGSQDQAGPSQTQQPQHQFPSQLSQQRERENVSHPNISYHHQRQPPAQQKIAWQRLPQRQQPVQQRSFWRQQRQQLPNERPEGSPKIKAADVVHETAELLSEVSLQEQLKAGSSGCEKKSAKLTVPADTVYKEVDQIPKRKDPTKAGTIGRPITVKTNMMAINVKQMNPNVVHYDVKIVPDTPKYLMRPVFLKVKKTLFPERNPAFDGTRNAFSAGELPIEDPSTAEVVVYNEDGQERKYKVTIKIVNRIDLSWLKTFETGTQDLPKNQQISIQALDVILRNAPALTSYVSIKSSFYTPATGQVVSLGGGMDLWVGLYQSAVLGWKLYFNVDVVHKGFPKPQTVLDLMKIMCGCDGQDRGGRSQYDRQRGYGPKILSADLINRRREEISKFLKGLKVAIEIPGQPTSRRTQRVNDLVICPRENVFERDGQRITVEQYYKLERKYTIKHPDFPCLWVGGRDTNIHVPPEICTIVGGQAVQKKLDEKQTSMMIRKVVAKPEERKKKIMDAFNSMRHNEDPCMKEFGVSVSGEFETVPARVLDPPQLSYQSQNVRVEQGKWRASQFINPSQLIKGDNTWTILNLSSETNIYKELVKLAETLIRSGSSLGMTVGRPLTPFKEVHKSIGKDMRELMEELNEMKKKQIRLVIVVVPEKKGIYSKVKQVSELQIGILTQCLRSVTLLDRLNKTTVDNIMLKINAKLNGTNHIIEQKMSLLACLKSPCMIVGADVTHPSPDSKGIPSIAAVVASHDSNAFNYNVQIRLQLPTQEHIGELAEIIKIQLNLFYEQTRRYPEKIIVFRDGVSESQFGQIMLVELRAIRKACQSIRADGLYKPEITFLVVQKRHHTRFFPTDLKNSDDKHGNVQAGTIVDTEITHPTHVDFYLVSHASIQGTARPTKYRCLCNESDMSEDEIENLTYYLCHMFSRCTRSVSYPTPTYYAHLAAFRARALTQDVDIDVDNLAEEQRKKLTIKEEILKKNPMFFV